jgi:hypothetical protein
LSTVALVLLGLLAACSGKPRPAAESITAAVPETPPREAMTRLLAAVQHRDVTAFLSLLPRGGTWRLLDTSVDPPEAAEMAFGEFALDLEHQTGWYRLLFRPRGGRSLFDFAVNTNPEDWPEEAPGRFVPPDQSQRDRVWVQWRREEQRWVVDEIASPL